MNTLLKDYLSTIELCEPQQFKNIVIVPLFTAANGAPDYLTLTEALQQQLAAITEVSVGGQVPNVKVTNSADLCLLLVDGEELIGARQNRTLNTSILLAGKSETVVPVSCTEAGRWGWQSAAFADAGYVSPHKMRKVKSSSVATALNRQMGHKSDQHAVWSAVHELCAGSHVHSPTSAMHDAIAAKAKELEEFLQHLQPLPNQKGLAVLVNGDFAGADVVSSARAYQVLHSKFVRSYALEALLEQKPVTSAKPREQVSSFISAARDTIERIHRVVGCGEDHRIEATGVAGAALVADGHIIHLNLYRD